MAYREGGSNPSPEIPKALQNRAKLNPTVKTVKKIAEFRTPTPQDVRKKGSKILKLPRLATVCQTQWRTEGGFKPPRNSEGPPKSCQTQPDCENC